MDYQFEYDHCHNTVAELEKEDLLGLLHMRFGRIPRHIQNKLMSIQENLDVFDRLFLIAVNAANWDVFEEEEKKEKSHLKCWGWI